MLAEAAGEPVETILCGNWPSASFPDYFERCIKDHNPDLVFLKVNWFWYGYESLPLRIERRFGRAGKAVGQAGTRFGATPLFANSRTFQTARRLVNRVLPGATYFTPQEIVERMEECIRRAARHENVVLVLRGPGGGWDHAPLWSDGARKRESARREHIKAHLQAACERHHVYYLGRPALARKELEQRLTPAWFRSSAAGHEQMGLEEGDAMVAAWRQAHALPSRTH
jgi:hypothetical protein